MFYAIACAVKRTFLSLQCTIFILQCTSLYTIHCAVYGGLAQVVLVHALIPPSISWLHCTHYTVFSVYCTYYTVFSVYCTHYTDFRITPVKSGFNTVRLTLRFAGICSYLNLGQLCASYSSRFE